MTCPTCNATNPQHALSCISCGTSFQQPCHNCANLVRVSAHFCPSCGQPVAFSPRYTPPPPISNSPPNQQLSGVTSATASAPSHPAQRSGWHIVAVLLRLGLIVILSAAIIGITALIIQRLAIPFQANRSGRFDEVLSKALFLGGLWTIAVAAMLALMLLLRHGGIAGSSKQVISGQVLALNHRSQLQTGLFTLIFKIQVSLEILTFQVVPNGPNRQSIPVELRGHAIHGVLTNYDQVEVPSTWKPGQTVHARQVHNLTTQAMVTVNDWSVFMDGLTILVLGWMAIWSVIFVSSMLQSGL